MKKLADSPKIVAKPDSTTSVKSHDTLLVYFPVNSTNDNLDNQTLTHIKEIISEATKSGKSIQITGHSDSQGPADKNLVLGLKRANRLKDLFIEKGVQEGRIKVFSKGQTQPIGDNATAEGRAKNRRAEVVLN
jgi:OOP family OmpA-OmpF porin